MYQRHREHLNAFRRRIEEDPYEALFGWSNRRIHGLWGKHTFAAIKAEMDGLFIQRAVVGSDPADQSDRDPKSPENGDKISKSAASQAEKASKRDIQATISWRRATRDASGQIHEDSGNLVYDPISNRMVPKDEPVSRSSHSNLPESGSQVKSDSCDAKSGAAHLGQGMQQAQRAATEHAVDAKPERHTRGAPLTNVGTARERVQGTPQADQPTSRLETSLDRFTSGTGVRDEQPLHSKTAVDANSRSQEVSIRTIFENLREERERGVAPQQNGPEKAKRALEHAWKKKADPQTSIAGAVSQDIKQANSKSIENPTMVDPRPKTQATAFPVQSPSHRKDQQRTSVTSHSAEASGSAHTSDSVRRGRSSLWSKIHECQRPMSPVLLKDKPLKSMNLKELVEHRARLTRKIRQHQLDDTKPTSVFGSKLQQEVIDLKKAFNAFENKWRHRPDSATTQRDRSNDDHNTKDRPVPNSASEPVPAEGDMSPKVVEFARNGRWYKDKAPHAKMITAEPPSKDQQLVKDIRAAYENAYGPIDCSHRQGPLRFDSEASNAPAATSQRQVGFAPDVTNAKGRVEAYLARSMSEASSTTQNVRSSLATMKESTPPRVNPIDKTSKPEPDLTPQTGNFASPTGFVNHDRPIDDTQLDESDNRTDSIDHFSSQTTSRTLPQRRVRREEPVFSGQLPMQKYTVSEVVEMLKEQGIAGKSYSDNTTSSKGGSRSTSSQRHARNKKPSRSWGQSAKYILLGGAVGTITSYVIGVMIDYNREPRVEGGYDRGFPTWDGQRSWRGSKMQATSPETPKSEQQLSSSERALHFSDMPLGGVEYPMMGLLVACIWYILAAGGS
ncbi:MAG: hypothetical protein Q9159_002521 [Coniocarpon cinnabarinum]